MSKRVRTLLVIGIMAVGVAILAPQSNTTGSIEYGIASVSPSGAAGGYAIPASCELGFEHNPKDCVLIPVDPICLDPAANNFGAFVSCIYGGGGGDGGGDGEGDGETVPSPACTANGDTGGTSVNEGDFASISCVPPPGATICSIAGTPLPLTVSPSDTTTYTVFCNNGGSAPVTVTVLHPDISVVANPGLIRSGSSSSITWSAVNVTAGSCGISGPNGFSVSEASGTKSTGPLTSESTYTLTCSTSKGSVSSQATVRIIPIITPF